MSLIYSGGPYRNDVYSISSRQGLLNNINTSLTASGWSSQNIFAFSELIYSANPTAGQTVTIGTQTYTFRATVGATANEVLIGATGTDTARNLFNAVNLGPGAGTTYGSATLLNANITAADFRSSSTSAGRFRVQSKINSTPFGQQALFTFSTTATGYVFSFPNNRIAGYIWTSPKTPQGQQQIRIYGVDAIEGSLGQDQIRLYVMDENELYRSAEFVSDAQVNNTALGFRLRFAAPGPSNWRIITGRYHIFAFLDGGAAPSGGAAAFSAGVPYIYSFLSPRVITNATNANPIVITEDAPHGYTTGTTVFTRGVEGNTAANGSNTITVISPTSYSIPVAGNGNYLTGGVSTRATDDKCGMIFWGAGDETGGRAFLYTRFGAETCTSYQNFNGNGFSQNNANDVGIITVLTAAPSRIQDAGSVMQFADGSRALLEPHLAISGTQAGKTRWAAQLYDTMITLDVQLQGTTANIDSRNWYCLGQSVGSTSQARGSVWVVIP